MKFPIRRSCDTCATTASSLLDGPTGHEPPQRSATFSMRCGSSMTNSSGRWPNSTRSRFKKGVSTGSSEHRLYYIRAHSGRIEHSCATNSADSLSPRASTPAPQTLALHKRVYARLDALWERVGVRGLLLVACVAPLTPPREDARRPSPTRGEGNGHVARESPCSPGG